MRNLTFVLITEMNDSNKKNHMSLSEGHKTESSRSDTPAKTKQMTLEFEQDDERRAHSPMFF